MEHFVLTVLNCFLPLDSYMFLLTKSNEIKKKRKHYSLRTFNKKANDLSRFTHRYHPGMFVLSLITFCLCIV